MPKGIGYGKGNRKKSRKQQQSKGNVSRRKTKISRAKKR